MKEHRYAVMDMNTGLFVLSLSDEAFRALVTYEVPLIPPESGQYVLRVEDLPKYDPSSYGDH